MALLNIFNMIPLVILTALLNTAAQLVLKMGMQKIGEFNFAVDNIIPIGLKIIFSPFIVIGVCIYVLSLILWLLVLSRIPVGIAYPLSSLGYVFSAIGAYYLMGENLSYIQMTGIAVIILGVYLLTQN